MNLSRRQTLKTLGSALLGAAASHIAPSALGAETKPTLHVYPNYGWLRGFGIVPSWGANVVEAWQLYDGARFREEVALAKQVHANCIRLWIEYAAWKLDPDKMTERFLDAVAGIAEKGMKVMPCLFNHWHDRKLDYLGTPLAGDWTPHFEYVKTIAKALAKDDRVLIWDLCNEPGSRDRSTLEFQWLSQIAATARECGVQQPITIGTMSGVNITTFAPLVDVLNGHPYGHHRNNLEALITSFTAMSKDEGKPFLVNETFPGAMDDLVRAEVVRFYSEMLSAAGFGWMGWVIREGKAIATRRDLPDGNGINGVGYHPFFTKEGKLRDGLEFLTEPPKLRPPWEKS
ncbi:cellulase (glycosyl hydrolase family 5) [Chthoniobacter flavus]|uniref:cellulase family glycosylhydrolase n=1 Tax=Chthoniobacter flavus TaxID=191863 RepID=UPI0010442F93|nr:cellulase family glycosylhydrolase [Chthoniobacter flavus]TCO89099.1 cellulase (glycosyl hydrolase family 5) [Chthoniobacter flavus]